MFKRTKKVASKIQTGVSRGLGISFLLNTGYYMRDTVKGFLNIPVTEQNESFAQAMRRMHLTDQQFSKTREPFLAAIFYLFMRRLIYFRLCYLFILASGLGRGNSYHFTHRRFFSICHASTFLDISN